MTEYREAVTTSSLAGLPLLIGFIQIRMKVKKLRPGG